MPVAELARCCSGGLLRWLTNHQVSVSQLAMELPTLTAGWSRCVFEPTAPICARPDMRQLLDDESRLLHRRAVYEVSVQQCRSPRQRTAKPGTGHLLVLSFQRAIIRPRAGAPNQIQLGTRRIGNERWSHRGEARACLSKRLGSSDSSNRNNRRDRTRRACDAETAARTAPCASSARYRKACCANR